MLTSHPGNRYWSAHMEGATLGLVGGVIGTVIGCLGAFLGARASYKAAVNDAQRRFYRRAFAWLTPWTLLFLVFVCLPSFEILPYWIYIVTMIIWLTSLGPAIYWMNRRLAKLSMQPD